MPFRDRLRRLLHISPHPSHPSHDPPHPPLSPTAQQPHHTASLSTSSLPILSTFGASKDPHDPHSPKRTRSQRALLYRPGEAMPRPKYPGRPNKPHQEMLRAFHFGKKEGWDSWDSDPSGRKGSAATDISPMGSRRGSERKGWPAVEDRSGSGAEGGGGGFYGLVGAQRHNTMVDPSPVADHARPRMQEYEPHLDDPMRKEWPEGGFEGVPPPMPQAPAIAGVAM